MCYIIFPVVTKKKVSKWFFPKVNKVCMSPGLRGRAYIEDPGEHWRERHSALGPMAADRGTQHCGGRRGHQERQA